MVTGGGGGTAPVSSRAPAVRALDVAGCWNAAKAKQGKVSSTSGDVAVQKSLCQGGGSETDPDLLTVPLLLFVPRQLWLLPRKAAAAESDNSISV